MTSISLAEYRRIYKPKRRAKRPGSVKKQRVVSEGEVILATALRALKVEFEQEFKFHPTRKWSADFHLKGKKVLVEVEGGIWSNGRHTRGKGYLGDLEKYNTATMMGYQVIRFSTEQVKSDKAIEKIEKLVGDLG